MEVTTFTKREPFNINIIHPAMQGPMMTLRDTMRALKYFHDGVEFRLYAFEGYRHPIRQYHLLTVDKTTKARPWQSAHQYGLAVDFAGRMIHEGELVRDWFWPNVTHHCWDDLKREARRVDLDVPISWDYGHVEHPLFREARHNLVAATPPDLEWNWIA